MKLIQHIFVFLFFLLLLSCARKDPKIAETETSAPVPYTAVVPEGWPQPVYNFAENEITEDKFMLGRSLFYETLLSKDNTISCGSCHQPFAAFANNDHKVSHGINGLDGKRNSPGIFNINWHPLLMHDGGINHIEVQPVGPISNPLEMGEEINHVISKLAATQKYKDLFRKAYGSEEINTARMFKAMAQFMGLMYSYKSKYDQYKRHENNVTLTEAESRGYDLFLAKCGACHKEPLFSDFQFRNNGLAVNQQYNDSGRARITLQPQDLYKFKTPSLRNIALTKPYMHDGRYATLEECLDHYTNNVTNQVNLDPLLKNGIPLTTQEKLDIIAFLNTLSDFEFVNDARFKEPR